MKILYVENHAIFAEQVCREFLSAYDVTVVASLAAARQALAAEKYELLIVDYDLDDGKGETGSLLPCHATYSEDHRSVVP